MVPWICEDYCQYCSSSGSHSSSESCVRLHKGRGRENYLFEKWLHPTVKETLYCSLKTSRQIQRTWQSNREVHSTMAVFLWLWAAGKSSLSQDKINPMVSLL